ncbi:MAG: lytic transglycosylase domain-containing protein, partial [Firmicutes bacterium]|nr:lytic transglycosylase domain-containing protein [Bacillota bacterium]
MTAYYRRKVNRKKFKNRLFFLLLFLLLAFNIDVLGRAFYPFPYRELTTRYASANGVDRFLLAAVMKAESGFDKMAVSSRGARGLMQIMPETGYWIAGQTGYRNFDPEQLFDPETSIRMGSWYMAELLHEFSGDPVLALAAYNGGRGNVRNWLSGGMPGGDADKIPFPET